MVASVARIPRVRTLQIPVLQLFQQLRAELENIDASHPALNRMYDVHSCDVLEDAIAEVRARRMAEPERPAIVVQLQHEYHNKQQRYHRNWMRWKSLRAKAWGLAHSPAQIVVELMPANWDREFPMMSMSVSDMPRFVTYEQAKEANAELERNVLELENFIAAFQQAEELESQDTGTQAWRMCIAYFQKINRMAERIEALETEVKQLKRSPTPKRKAQAV
jgi:hypothetical protein